MTFTNLHMDLSGGATGVLPIANGGTNSSTALSNGLLVKSSSGKLVESTMTDAKLLSMPYWTKYTVTYTDMSFAGLTNDITLFTLPLKTLIHKVIIKQSTAFAGSTIASYTLSVGIVGTLAKYIAAYDVFAAVAATTFGVAATTINAQPENFTAGVAIRVAAIAVGANLSAATAGAADIWVETSLLP